MLALMLAVVLLSFCSFEAVAAVVEKEPGLDFYLAKDSAWKSGEHQDEMKKLGIRGATVYYNLTDNNNRTRPLGWVRSEYLNKGYPVILVLVIKDSNGHGLFRRVVEGNFDTDLQALAVAVRAAGKPIVIRPFHELDASWHQWGMSAAGNSPELAAAAVKHVVQIFRNGGADNVRFEINFNRRDGRGKVLGEIEKYFPLLDPWVEMYSISTYNRCGTNPTYTKEVSFADDFRPAYERLSGLTKKAINIAEVSTSGLCGSRLAWFKAMLEDIKTEFTQVKMVTFFFGNVPVGGASNNVPIQWGFGGDGEQEAAFKELLKHYQRADFVALRSDDKSYSFSAPWSLQAFMTYPITEEENTALNPFTGRTFGKTGTVFRSQFTQRWLFDFDNGWKAGPGIKLGADVSNNRDQWWNNQTSAYGTFGFYRDLPRNSVIGWGGFSFEVLAGRKWYLGPAPDRFSGGGEGFVGIRAGVNFGGDWTNR